MKSTNQQAKEKGKKFNYFVDGAKFETDEPALTAAQILARVPSAEPGDKLSLEGHGSEPDRLIGDEELVELAKVKGPLRFTLVPSASFGA